MQIVWPVGCQRTAELTAVENVLKGMDSSLITSKDSTCPGAEGLLFWSGAFTTDQSDLLKEKYGGFIAAIEPNVRIYKQTQSKVVKYPPTGSLLDPQTALNFISTAPDTESSGQYAYFFQDKWASDVTLFMFDDEYEETNPEFRFSDITLLSAAGADKALAKDKSGHGTCLLSAALGNVYGVAKRLPRVIFTQVRLRLNSILDGLKGAAVMIGQWRQDGHEVRGYTVMLMAILVPRVGTLTETKFKSLLELLVNDLQVVFVVGAGQDDVNYPHMQSPNKEVIHMPARYSLDYDIITVGAVSVSGGAGFGAQQRNTHGGNFVTVYAPGQGFCAKDYKYGTFGITYDEGTSIAAGYTAGLVAYLLGLPDLGPHLRTFPNIPKAVKEYIQQKAYSRNRNPAKSRLAIWNGLDAHATKDEWSYWIGDPHLDN